MSEIYNRPTVVPYTVMSGLVVDVAYEKTWEALDSGMYAGDVLLAVGSALARAGHAGRTVAKRALTKEYNVSGSTFLNYTKNINHFDGDYGAIFGFQGHVIPLIRFSYVTGLDRVTVNVRNDTGPQVLEHAFVQRMGSTGHLGIYERVGPERLPIRELYGPATPQMMYSNQNVIDAVDQAVKETFEKRIDHELERVMNGWGVHHAKHRTR